MTLCLFTATYLLQAQWIQTNGPGGDIVTALAVSPNGAGGTNLFAGTSGGVFLSTNNGASWSTVNSGLTSTSILSFAVSGTKLFAATDTSGVFLSTNSGASWTNIGIGLGPYTSVNALAVNGTNLIAGTSNQGVYISANNGASWTECNAGLTSRYVYALAVSGTDLFAGGGGVFRSTDTGANWTQVTVALVSVYALAVKDKNLFAGGSDLFLSTDSGTSWSAANSGIAGIVSSFAVSGTSLFAGTDGGVFLSTNSGTSWSAVNTGLTSTDVRSLSVSGPNLFAGTFGGSVFSRPLSEMITSVERLSTDLPTRFILDQNYPNPFNPATTFSFSIPSRSFVSLRVFDALAREVSVVLSEELPAGNYSRQWNAADLPSGMYFYRLQTSSFTETKRLIFIK